MIKTIKFNVFDPEFKNSRYFIEAELEVLNGVNSAVCDYGAGECLVKFDDELIGEQKIKNIVKEIAQNSRSRNKGDQDFSKKECVYSVSGMHCASCEVLIEKELLKKDNIKSVEASAHKGELVIVYEGRRPTLGFLKELFSKEDYVFFEKNKQNLNKKDFVEQVDGKNKTKNIVITTLVALALIFVFLILHKSGFSAWVNINNQSALPMFILFGLLAGFSSCAALTGGIILSMSKQWLSLYSKKDSMMQKLQPHFLFNAGRLLAYGILGGVLGALGNVFQLSISFMSFLVLLISVMMIFLALQMLGFKRFQRFQITMPRFVTRYVADEFNFQGRYMPALMGAGTFFLPCGFTITAQGLALASGDAWQGALIMFFFALGTLVPLFIMGLSSVGFSKKPHLATGFMKVAGVMVLFFALFNINAQLNVLGLTSLDDISFGTNKEAIASEEGFPEIVNGKQILKMDAQSFAYSPNRLKVRAGIPVRWEITDKGTSGCTNAIMSKGLFDGQISLTPGELSVKEFTQEKPGRYKFSCWMGMISGVIDVVDVDDKEGSAALLDEPIVESGAKGCGCGGGGGTGSCGG